MKTALSFSLPTPTRVFKTLGIAILILTILSLLGQYSRFSLGHGRLFGFVPEFWLDGENNIPTYFSALMLLSSSLLLGLIARFVRATKAGFYGHWVGLSLIFCYLSIDEFASLHESLIEPLRALLGTGGLFYFAWTLPALGLLAGFALAYARFFWHLPSAWKGPFATAGLVYVGGALGMEMIGGRYREGLSEQTFPYALITTVEEVLEMVGIALFICVLLAYLQERVSRVSLGFDVQLPTAPSTNDAPPSSRAHVDAGTGEGPDALA